MGDLQKFPDADKDNPQSDLIEELEQQFAREKIVQKPARPKLKKSQRGGKIPPYAQFRPGSVQQR